MAVIDVAILDVASRAVYTWANGAGGVPGKPT